MNLAASRSARLKNKLVMRLGCVLVAVGFLVSSVVTPRARAVAVVDDVAVGALSCAAFLESIGLPLSATGGAGAVSGGITAVAGEYAAATGAAASGEAVLGSIAAGTAISTAGTIILTAAAVAACAALAYWLYNTYLVDASSNNSVVVYSDGDFFSFRNGETYIVPRLSSLPLSLPISTGVLNPGSNYIFTDGTYYFQVLTDGFISYYSDASGRNWVRHGSYLIRSITGLQIFIYDNAYYAAFLGLKDYATSVPGGCYTKIFDIPTFLSVRNLESTSSPSLLVNSAQNFDLSIFSDLDGKQMEITIPSAAPGSTLAELVETVPQQVVDGTLSATYTIDTAPPSPPSISDGDVEDVDDLGLPSLGEALTRRFPFSIPWDIARGITLLAAPAKAPYFEVDFYEVIGDRVGGWKGSTKLVLDFSEYEILGRLSRWTSTIGFCLFLASATKRFIWTA